MAGWWEAAVQHRDLGSVLCDDLEGSDRGRVGGGSGGKGYMCAYN